MIRRSGIGHFIVLEGLDGAGTTTQVSRLADALRREGHRVLATREPSDGPVGMLIRQALIRRLVLPGARAPLSHRTLALLFAADRADHLEAEVEPALARGEIVLCDRYVLSSLAYQGTSLPIAWVESLNAAARSPDLTLFLSVDAGTAARRRQGRGGAPELFEARAQQERIARKYQAALKRLAVHERIVRVDGAQEAAQVTRDCLEAIRFLVTRRRAGR